MFTAMVEQMVWAPLFEQITVSSAIPVQGSILLVSLYRYKATVEYQEAAPWMPILKLADNLHNVSESSCT
jgi:hypothetical protein